ncbi:hypothetical protein HA402_014449 [Bradysia odoriphaga]|nr:hypothetical protein HA402_014449 [Bradysia odoriphaga]
MFGKYRLFSSMLILAVLINALTHYVDAHTCPKNQEWTECGSACPPRCDSDPNQACTMQCVIGCQCKKDYVLNRNGKCVLRSEC